MKIRAIYDNGGATLDRYTIVFEDGPNGCPDYINGRTRISFYLACSETGAGFSQWGEIKGRLGSFLGKRVKWADLNETLKRHIRARIKE